MALLITLKGSALPTPRERITRIFGFPEVTPEIIEQGKREGFTPVLIERTPAGPVLHVRDSVATMPTPRGAGETTG